MSASQEALLRAAVLRGADAVAGWNAWKARERMTGLDRESHSILPLVYVNLRDVSSGDPSLEQLRLTYLATWVRNQQLFAAIVPVLRRLHDAGIETMLLKGAAVLHLYYVDYGARLMGDVDLLVHRDGVRDAFEVLTEGGLRPTLNRGLLPSGALLRATHATAFVDPVGCCRIDLHWKAFGQSQVAVDEGDIWRQSVPVEVLGVHTAAMGPTHLLFHTILHGTMAGGPSSLRWLADAAKLLDLDAARVDWDYLMRSAEASDLGLVLGEALEQLVRFLEVPVPREVLAQLASSEPSEREVAILKARSRPLNSVGALRRLRALISEYEDLRREAGEGRSILGFLHFLQSMWGVHSPVLLPFYAVEKSVRWSFWQLRWSSVQMARTIEDLGVHLVHLRQGKR
jgi:hypothetical protein